MNTKNTINERYLTKIKSEIMDVIQKETSVVLSDKIGQKIDEIFETNIHLAKEDYAAMTTNDMPENYGSEGLKASVLEVEELMHNITSGLDNKDTVYNFSETEKALGV